MFADLSVDVKILFNLFVIFGYSRSVKPRAGTVTAGRIHPCMRMIVKEGVPSINYSGENFFAISIVIDCQIIYLSGHLVFVAKSKVKNLVWINECKLDSFVY